MTPLPLTPEEKAIAERQCQGCLYWNWHNGCGWWAYEGKAPLPVEDCGMYENHPIPDCGAFGEVK